MKKLAIHAVFGAIALAVALTAGPASASAKPRPPLYWGAQIGTQMTGTQAPYDMVPVHRFQRLAGKGLSLVQFASPFADCSVSPCRFYEFPWPAMENARLYGAIPVLSWASVRSPGEVSDPEYRLANIASGHFDTYIRSFALQAKSWGHPFFLRFNWEMNGFWFPWSDSANGNRPGDFRAAWRHVHDVFDEVGATNATWVWCPNVNISDELQPLGQIYPGGRYVDWTCLDGFNWGDRGGSPGWLSFDEIFRKTYREVIDVAPTKPMLIAETASTVKGGSKAAWIKNALHVIKKRYRKIRGLIWFDVNDRGTKWPIENQRKPRNAFRRGITSPLFRPNMFGQLPPGAIAPPR